jgi:hypothetical protein
VSAIAARIEETFPSYSRDWRVQTLPLLEATVRDVRPLLLVLFGAVTLLLFVACGNVATLAISRTVARQAEFSVRRALGATNGRIVRQLFIESAVLASLGGIVGVLLSWWGTGAVQIAISPGMNLPRTAEIAVNGRTLGFACVVTVARSGVDVARVAVSHDRRRRVAGTRNARCTRPASSACHQHGHRRRGSARPHVARRHGPADSHGPGTHPGSPGFIVDRVLTMRATLSKDAYASDDRVRAFGSELLRVLDSAPQISRAGFANYLPMSRSGAATASR